MNIDQSIESNVKESDYYRAFEDSQDFIGTEEGIEYLLNDKGVHVIKIDEETDVNMNNVPFLCSPLFILNASKYMKSGKFALTIAYKFKANWFCMKLNSSDINEDICFKLTEVGIKINPTSENKTALIHYLSVLLSQMDEVEYIHEQETSLNNSSIANAIGRKLFRLKDRLQKWMNVIKEEEKRGE